MRASAGSTGPKNYWSGHDFFDTSQWIVYNRIEEQPGGLGYYRPGNVTLTSGGILQLTPKVESFGGQSYTTAGLQFNTFCWHGGTLTVRAKINLPRGSIPAIWMLGGNCMSTNPTDPTNVGTCNWPNYGSREIDIVECYNGVTTQINFQVHSDLGNPGGLLSASDVSTAFHVYDFVWVPGVSMTLKQDGTTLGTVSTFVPDELMGLILQIGLSNQFTTINNADYVDPNACSMFIDYISLNKN